MRDPEIFDNDRSVYRRHVDTVDRLDYLKEHGSKGRLPHYAILHYGLEHLDRECKVAAADEMWETIKRVFSPSPNPIGV